MAASKRQYGSYVFHTENYYGPDISKTMSKGFFRSSDTTAMEITKRRWM